MPLLEEIKESTIDGDADKTVELVRKAINDGIGIDHIIQNGLTAAMEVVGELFSENEIFVPEMLVAARAMQEGLKVVKPYIRADEVKSLATVVIGSVKGDLHDIGKNLVGMLLEGSGCKVIDVGIDVSAEKFIEAVREHQPQFLALSALLTTTMPQMKLVIDALKEANLNQKVKVLIGGAPVTQKFADEIGADGYAADAGAAVKKIKELLDS
jgi:5-methyltetrahydrofolate--homocysteine methyltransferase